tara:strand:- start:1611 stop:1739 length:129 start_codon:yes stop_codon:yes gene_type:complete
MNTKKQQHIVEERLTILKSIKNADGLVTKQPLWKDANKAKRT